MKWHATHARRAALALTLLALLGSAALLALMRGVPPEPLMAEHQAALARWALRAPAAYRIALRVEYRGQSCYQSLEVRSELSPRVLRNTCNPLWLEPLTGSELLNFTGQIARIPQRRCTPSADDCVCERVFSARAISYDEQSGLPLLVLTRSDLRPAWGELAFWRRLLADGRQPCSPSPRRVTIEVNGVAPLP